MIVTFPLVLVMEPPELNDTSPELFNEFRLASCEADSVDASTLAVFPFLISVAESEELMRWLSPLQLFLL